MFQFLKPFLIKFGISKPTKEDIPLDLIVQQTIRDIRDRIPELNLNTAKCFGRKKDFFKEITTALQQQNTNIDEYFLKETGLAFSWKRLFIQYQASQILREYIVQKAQKFCGECMDYVKNTKYSPSLGEDFEKRFRNGELSEELNEINSLNFQHENLLAVVDKAVSERSLVPLRDYLRDYKLPKENFQETMNYINLSPADLFEIELRQNLLTNSEPAYLINKDQENTEPSSENEHELIDRNLVFISYSRKDKRWLEMLQMHLKPYEREGIKVWDDTKIEYGKLWKPEIKKAINAAKVTILLISPHFLASDFIIDEELPPLLAAAQNEGAIVIPLIIKHSAFANTKSISCYQAFNQPEKPLADLPTPKREEIFAKLTSYILNVMSTNK
jgi:hypothetical protein